MDACPANEDAMFGFFPHSATGIGAMVWKARDLRAVFGKIEQTMQARQEMRVMEVMSRLVVYCTYMYLYLSDSLSSRRRQMSNPVCFYASISSWQHGSGGVTQLSGSGYRIALSDLPVS
jgi:hypothetical protein